jgi:hypothetical protein
MLVILYCSDPGCTICLSAVKCLNRLIIEPLGVEVNNSDYLSALFPTNGPFMVGTALTPYFLDQAVQYLARLWYCNKWKGWTMFLKELMPLGLPSKGSRERGHFPAWF